jgi:hypothetical protein
MKRFVEGLGRGQSTLFPASLDDYVTEDNPVRAGAVWIVVGIWSGAISGNLKLSFQAARSIG